MCHSHYHTMTLKRKGRHPQKYRPMNLGYAGDLENLPARPVIGQKNVQIDPIIVDTLYSEMTLNCFRARCFKK